MRILSFDIGIRNLAYCLIEGQNNEAGELLCSIVDWDVINLCQKDEKVKKVSLQTLCARMIEQLNAITEIHESIDYVILENQPVYMNPKMKSVQMMLFTYFIMKDGAAVKMFSPRNKLKVYTGPPVECTLKSKYSRTKFFGIQYCKYMIQSCAVADFFERHKKKDDLADSFLQGVLYLQKQLKPSAIQII